MKIDNIEDKIVLYIKYDKPIELRNFSIGLDCFQRLYTNITEKFFGWAENIISIYGCLVF